MRPGRRRFADRIAHPIRTLRNAGLTLRQRVREETWKRRAVINDRVLADWIGDQNFPLPFVVMFETISQCNGTCAFCPANRVVDRRGVNLMPLEILEKAFAELGRLDYRGWISFHINNEPLLDDRLPEIIRLARARVPGAFIQFWTNGTLLDWNRHKVLFENGLNFLRINNYSATGCWHKNVKKFLAEFRRSAYTRHPLIEVAASIRDPNAILTNKGGAAPNKLAGNDFIPLQEKCHLPFWQFPVNYRGDVFLCCHDNVYSCTMGSLRERTILDIWNSPRYTAFREALLKGDRTVADVCARCDVLTTSGALRVRTGENGRRVFLQPKLVSKRSLHRAYTEDSRPLE